MTNVTVSQFSDHPAEPIDKPNGNEAAVKLGAPVQFILKWRQS